MQTARTSRAPAEGGFVMIEVLVSALVILIVAGAVLSLMTATTRSAADQRQKAAAYSVAQEDQARLRAMRLTSLNRLEQERTVTLDGTKYTIVSRGRFVNNSTGNDSACESTASAADYVRIGSTVTWENGKKSASLNSVVAPSNGSLNPNNGALLVTIENGTKQKLAGVGLSGTGAGSFSGKTDANGCASFYDLPVGNYALKAEATGFVNADGVASPWTQTVGVETAQTKTVQLRYDQPGRIEARFKYKEGSVFRPATADSIVVYHAEIPTGAKSFGTPGGTRLSSIVTPLTLFPFETADTVYPGYCEKQNKPTDTAATGQAIVTRNGTAVVEIQMPTLNLTVTKSGSPVSGATVKLTDKTCVVGSTSVTREYKTEANGHLANPTTLAAEPWVPWGTYEVCVASGGKRKTGEVAVTSLSGASLALALPTSGGSGSC